MFSTDLIFKQQENLVDNQKCQAGFRPLCNKILVPFTAKMICAYAEIRANAWVGLELRSNVEAVTRQIISSFDNILCK